MEVSGDGDNRLFLRRRSWADKGRVDIVVGPFVIYLLFSFIKKII